MIRRLFEAAIEPDGAVIELVEIVSASTTTTPPVVVPNQVRINGVSCHTAVETPIKIHAITGNDAVLVTVTLIAKSVSIHAETPDGQRTID